MSYKTIPDEDDGFGQLIPLCREFTIFRVNPQSKAFAAIPGGTITGPVIEVQIVKILDHYGLEIAIPARTEKERTTYVMISSKKSRLVDEVSIPKVELRSSAELFSFKNLKEENPACHSRRLASRKLVQAMLKVQQATRKVVRTPSKSLPARRLCSHKEPFLRPRGIGKLFQELCQKRSPKWLQKWSVSTITTNDNLTQHFIGTPAGSVRKTWSTRFLRSTMASTYP